MSDRVKAAKTERRGEKKRLIAARTLPMRRDE